MGMPESPGALKTIQTGGEISEQNRANWAELAEVHPAFCCHMCENSRNILMFREEKLILKRNLGLLLLVLAAVILAVSCAGAAEYQCRLTGDEESIEEPDLHEDNPDAEDGYFGYNYLAKYRIPKVKLFMFREQDADNEDAWTQLQRYGDKRRRRLCTEIKLYYCMGASSVRDLSNPPERRREQILQPEDNRKGYGVLYDLENHRRLTPAGTEI